MLRIALFIATNIAIIALISITFSLLGFQGLLAQNGVDLDLVALLVYSAVIGFAGSFISLLLSKFMAKRAMNVHIITEPRNQTEAWLLRTVRRQAEQANICMPEVGIFNSHAPNAFATGWSKNNSLVAVSTGLIDIMNQSEVEAVLAHEVAHVANGDMVTMTLLQGVVNTFVIFLSRIIGHTVDRVVFKVERGHGPAFWIVSIICEVVLGFLAHMITMWFSRKREYRADADAAKMVGNTAMINALLKLKNPKVEDPLADEVAAFGINSNVKQLFSSHPPIDARVAALRQQ